MSVLEGTCGFCFALGGSYRRVGSDDAHSDPAHCQSLHPTFDFCPEPTQDRCPSAGEARRAWVQLKRCVQYGEEPYCYYCGLPEGQYLPNCHRAAQKPYERCSYRDFIIKSIWASKCSPGTWERMRRTFGLEENISNEAFGRWLSRTPSAAHFNNQLRLFLWIVDRWRVDCEPRVAV